MKKKKHCKFNATNTTAVQHNDHPDPPSPSPDDHATKKNAFTKHRQNPSPSRSVSLAPPLPLSHRLVRFFPLFSSPSTRPSSPSPPSPPGGFAHALAFARSAGEGRLTRWTSLRPNLYSRGLCAARNQQNVFLFTIRELLLLYMYIVRVSTFHNSVKVDELLILYGKTEPFARLRAKASTVWGGGGVETPATAACSECHWAMS